MERAQAARKKAQDELQVEPSLQVQVHALERARDELVDWVQGELAKMEENSVFLEDASPIKRPVNAVAPVDLASAESQIRESYNKYIEARAGLLEAHASLQQPLDVQTENQNGGQSIPSEDSNATTTKPVRPTTKLLPCLPHLAKIANNERSLLQQSVYLQNQMASANQDMEEALLRLSGESHLLPAGSKDVAIWGKMAREAEAVTEEFVKERLQASRQEVGSVSTIVELCSLQSQVLESA